MKSPFHLVNETYEVSRAWIAFDQVVPVHRASQVKLLPFEASWIDTLAYLQAACAQLGIPRPGRLSEAEGTQIRATLGEPPIASIAIYMISVSEADGSRERCVYVGKTNATTHRFRSGHAAFTKLHHPKYDGLLKRLYLGCLAFEDDDHHLFYTEWTHPPERRLEVMSVVEETLILALNPELNSRNRKSSQLAGAFPVSVQNTVGRLLDGGQF